MQTIGERLEEARKKKGISIREAAEATKIRGDYLQKFESNDFDIGLTEIYTRGFLRSYAAFLKVPSERILNDYAALGRNEVRPRQPNREIYGKMDISVSSATDQAERAAPPPEETGDANAPGRGQGTPRYPRGSTNLPTGPDPAVIWRYLKWGIGAIVVLLLLLIINSLISSSTSSTARTATPATASAPPASPSAAAASAASGNSYSVVALDTVFVRITNLIPPDTDGDEIFKGTLTKGQSQVVPWNGPQNVWASAGENLMIEYQGRRFPSGFTGYSHAQMKDPRRK